MAMGSWGGRSLYHVTEKGGGNREDNVLRKADFMKAKQLQQADLRQPTPT